MAELRFASQDPVQPQGPKKDARQRWEGWARGLYGDNEEQAQAAAGAAFRAALRGASADEAAAAGKAAAASVGVAREEIVRAASPRQHDKTGRSLNARCIALLAVSVTAIGASIGAIGLLAGPVAAQAAPCDQYQFSGPFNLKQGNGFRVETFLTGQSTEGEATALPGGNRGRVKAYVNGRNVLLDIHWNGGANGVYSGTVDDNGFVHGTSWDATRPPAKTSWNSETTITCMPPPPAPAPAPKKLGRAPVRVFEPVDVYNVKNEPDGAGTVIGMLHAGDFVVYRGVCVPKSWCNVYGSNVPTGNGWVWGALEV